MLKRYFEFEFYDMDGECLGRFALRLPDGTVDDSETLDEEMIEFCGNAGLEYDYGVHDCFGARTDEHQSLSFNSSEVPAEKIPALMSIWRGFFASHFGEGKIGAVVKIPDTVDTQDLAAVYAHLTKAPPSGNPRPRPQP